MKTVIYILAGFLFILAAPCLGQTEAGRLEAGRVVQTPSFTLTQLSYPRSADHLSISERQETPVDLIVVLQENGQPAPERAIRLSLIESPQSRRRAHPIQWPPIVTDAQGRAVFHVLPEEGPGDYVFAASLNDERSAVEPVLIRLVVKSGTWLITLLIGLIGGLALFLFGMDQAGRNLQKVAGDRMRAVLGAMTRNPWRGAALGTVITFFLQSSSASTVMLVGLVSATLLTLSQAIGIIIGAKIGTTLTVQIIAFNIGQYSLGLVASGLILYTLSKIKRYRRIGKIIMGFGFIFFGMGLMSDAMIPLRSEPQVADLMLSLGSRPVLALLFAAVFTAVIQSSSATIGVAMAMASQGMLSLSACIPISMGAAIGTCATALLASLNSSRSGKQVAVAHLLYSLLAVAVFLPFLDVFVQATEWISAAMNNTSIARQVAIGFTLFAVGAAVVFLPFAKLLEKLTLLIIPVDASEKAFQPKYLEESSLAFPSVAIHQAYLETLHMAELLRRQLVGVALLIQNPSERRCYELAEEDDKIDRLERSIRPFLARMDHSEIDDEGLLQREQAIITAADALESMGDIIVKSLLHALEKMAQHDLGFSQKGKDELLYYLGSLIERFDRLSEAARREDGQAAQKIREEGTAVEWAARRLRTEHIKRLHTGQSETLESSEGHLTVIDSILSIHRRITDIAIAISGQTI